MSEKAPRWNYGNQDEITAEELVAAYSAAPACHHPSPVETVPFTELPDDMQDTVWEKTMDDTFGETDESQEK
ncbi:MAG TPA: hypothetical protein VFM68_02225 [Candidatus Saccharimonadales bacterium]|nr:hypothetical protein [Candidatus Saccharimonadales bacterium]